MRPSPSSAAHAWCRASEADCYIAVQIGPIRVEPSLSEHCESHRLGMPVAIPGPNGDDVILGPHRIEQLLETGPPISSRHRCTVMRDAHNQRAQRLAAVE